MIRRAIIFVNAIRLIALVAIVGLAMLGPEGIVRLCLHAQTVAAQERRLPPGHFCVEPAKARTAEAHACTCHKICVELPDGSLHVREDGRCLDYCEKSKCTCAVHDCP